VVKYRAGGSASAIFQTKMGCPLHLAFEDRGHTESQSERYWSSQTRMSPSILKQIARKVVRDTFLT
jgi:hypothetical protein